MFRVNTITLKLAAWPRWRHNAITVQLTAGNTRKTGGSFAPGSMAPLSARTNLRFEPWQFRRPSLERASIFIPMLVTKVCQKRRHKSQAQKNDEAIGSQSVVSTANPL
jgi:hypothetical protein